MPAAVTCEKSPIEDIEDLFTVSDPAPPQRPAGYSEVVPRVRKNRVSQATSDDTPKDKTDTEEDLPTTDSIIPGKRTGLYLCLALCQERRACQSNVNRICFVFFFNK